MEGRCYRLTLFVGRRLNIITPLIHPVVSVNIKSTADWSLLFGEEKEHRVFIVKEAGGVVFLTQQFGECVSCGGAVSLWRQQRVEGDLTKPLQGGGDPAGNDIGVSGASGIRATRTLKAGCGRQHTKLKLPLF